MTNTASIRTRIAHTAATIVLATAAPATAQSIDHAEFEAIFGEPVTTSATGAPQRASDVPAAMTIITGEEIRRSGAVNLAEALRGRAGIDVNHFTAQQYDVAIRGANQPFNPSLLVMVNGRQIYLDHYGMTSWSNLGIELSEIRQVEIVKGPVSALFGFNAASGAINIITYDPIGDQVNSVSAQLGNGGARTVSAVATLHAGSKFGARLSAGYGEQDEFTPVGPTAPGGPYRENLALDIGFKPSETVTARLDYSYSRSFQTAFAPSFSSVGMMYRTNGAKGEVSADTRFGLLTGSVDYADLVNEYDVLLTGKNLDSFNTRLLVGRVQDIVKTGTTDTIRVTAEFRRNAFTQRFRLNGKIAYTVASGGLMWDHRFSDKVALNLAARADRLDLGQSGPIDPVLGIKSTDFDESFTTWSANAGLIIRPDHASTIRIQAARGIQAPSLIALGGTTRFSAAPGVLLNFSGSPDLRPSVSESAEIGYVRSVEQIGGKFSANAFYVRSKDVQTLDRGVPFLNGVAGVIIPAAFTNSGGVESYGIETSLNGRLSAALTWQLDYTYDQVHNHFTPKTAPGSQPFRALTPRHKLGASIGYSHGPLTLDLRGLLRSKVSFPLAGAERESGWAFGLNGRAGWRIADHAEIFATGENLTDARFIDNGYIRQAVRGRFGVRFDL